MAPIMGLELSRSLFLPSLSGRCFKTEKPWGIVEVTKVQCDGGSLGRQER